MVVQPRLWSRAERRQLLRGVGNSFSKIQKPPRPLWLGWGAGRFGIPGEGRGEVGHSSVPLTHRSASVEPSPTEEELKPPSRYLTKESGVLLARGENSSLFFAEVRPEDAIGGFMGREQGVLWIPGLPGDGVYPPSESEGGVVIAEGGRRDATRLCPRPLCGRGPVDKPHLLTAVEMTCSPPAEGRLLGAL